MLLLGGIGFPTPILAVAGNHDQMTEPYSNATSDSAYASFQRRLQRRAEQIGYHWYQDTSGAYSIQIGCVEVIGLNIVVSPIRTAIQTQKRKITCKRT